MADNDDERIAKKEARIAELQAEVRKMKKQQRAKAEKARVQRQQNAGAAMEELLGEEVDRDRAAEIAVEYLAAQAIKKALGMDALTADGAAAVAELAKLGQAVAEQRTQQPAPRQDESIWAGEPQHGIDPITGVPY